MVNRMKLETRYHENTHTLHIGCEEPRAYFVPYESREKAEAGDRSVSAYLRSLCGEWDFCFCKNVEAAPDVCAPGFSAEGFDRITVPRSWQTCLGKGYDVPQYTNINYPFPFDPPYVPDENPCGLYTRTFLLPEGSLAGKKTYLVFEGVDSCFYLYVNGRFAAYSQVSHMTSEIDVSSLVKEGENRISLYVLKWCDGSYLEDQDMWRMSGIFRECYLLSRDEKHLADVSVKTELSDDFRNGKVEISMIANGKVSADIYFEGEKKGSAELSKDGGFVFDVSAPSLWSDEQPVLYKLTLKCGNEWFSFDVGFRRIEIRNQTVLLNGKPIKALGVNRHDSHPTLGHTTPYEHILRDLKIIKASNCNIIRTSHYPNDPRLPELCDRLGLLLVAECDLESHGIFVAGNGSYINSDPEFRDAFVDRIRLLYERDKNHPSVIIWSLGNETGFGPNHDEMTKWLRDRDGSRLVHYEAASTYFSHGGEEKYNICDLDSRMYPSIDDVKKRLKEKSFIRPYFCCEFAHAMGNGPGGLKEYIELFESDRRIFGGCIWELIQHSVEITLPDGRKGYTYGGDFGDTPNDGNFCVDGLLYPDRSLSNGMREAKQAFKPFACSAEETEKGIRLTVFNKRYFRPLSDFVLEWRIEEDGKTVADGEFPLKAAPRSRQSVTLDVPKANPVLYGRTLIVTVRYAHTCEWAQKGDEVGFEQFELAAVKKQPLTVEHGFAPVLSETEDGVAVRCGETEYTFCRQCGDLTSIRIQGRELLASPLSLDIWRAPTDNERETKNGWYYAGYCDFTSKCYSFAAEQKADTVVLTAQKSIAGASKTPILKYTASYTVTPDGLQVSVAAECGEKKPFLPRFGMAAALPGEFEKIRYYGLGPVENYPDKRLAAYRSMFDTTADGAFENYVMPQENGAHGETEYLRVTDESGFGLIVRPGRGNPAFSFNCLPYSSRQLTKAGHAYELEKDGKVYLNVDSAQSGVGSHSCGPELPEKYRIKAEKLSLDFVITPLSV